MELSHYSPQPKWVGLGRFPGQYQESTPHHGICSSLPPNDPSFGSSKIVFKSQPRNASQETTEFGHDVLL